MQWHQQNPFSSSVCSIKQWPCKCLPSSTCCFKQFRRCNQTQYCFGRLIYRHSLGDEIERLRSGRNHRTTTWKSDVAGGVGWRWTYTRLHRLRGNGHRREHFQWFSSFTSRYSFLNYNRIVLKRWYYQSNKRWSWYQRRGTRYAPVWGKCADYRCFPHFILLSALLFLVFRTC